MKAGLDGGSFTTALIPSASTAANASASINKHTEGAASLKKASGRSIVGSWVVALKVDLAPRFIVASPHLAELKPERIVPPFPVPEMSVAGAPNQNGSEPQSRKQHLQPFKRL